MERWSSSEVSHTVKLDGSRSRSSSFPCPHTPRLRVKPGALQCQAKNAIAKLSPPNHDHVFMWAGVRNDLLTIFLSTLLFHVAILGFPHNIVVSECMTSYIVTGFLWFSQPQRGPAKWLSRLKYLLPSLRTCLSPRSTWWKERISSHKLSSDFYMCGMDQRHIQPHPYL